jgi:hypothetical protein
MVAGIRDDLTQSLLEFSLRNAVKSFSAPKIWMYRSIQMGKGFSVRRWTAVVYVGILACNKSSTDKKIIYKQLRI